jgi:hypothetical protein
MEDGRWMGERKDGLTGGWMDGQTKRPSSLCFCLLSYLILWCFPSKLYMISYLLYACYMPHPSYNCWLNHRNNISWRIETGKVNQKIIFFCHSKLHPSYHVLLRHQQLRGEGRGDMWEPWGRIQTQDDCVGFKVITAVVMKSTIFWDIKPYSPLRLFFRPRRWRRYVPPKRRLIPSGLHGVIF